VYNALHFDVQEILSGVRIHWRSSRAERGHPHSIILAFSATAGVLVEFYDFFIYGYAAASAFPAIFFPKLPPTQALVFSYLAFGAAFPARLLGAFIFGHFGDRAGRKCAFLVNILIVGVTTCLTGSYPGTERWVLLHLSS
jgi:MFS family permease